MCPQMSAVYPLGFLSLYVSQGLLQNVYLVFENSVEDLLSKKGCQQSQGGRCPGPSMVGPSPVGRAVEGKGMCWNTVPSWPHPGGWSTRMCRHLKTLHCLKD